MRVLKAFLRGWNNPCAALPSFAEPVVIDRTAEIEATLADLMTWQPPGPRPEPQVKLDHLLDLALIMRELWMQDAGFSGSGDRARSIVLAALLRLFPDRAEPSIAECLRTNCPGLCDDCPADARTPAVWLDQFLQDVPRPLVSCTIPPEDVDDVIADLREAKMRHVLNRSPAAAGRGQ